ncbi:SusC/RagA family TonB-linked outer membrane protein [Confluentibacter sediminis]|uniref:SusC/RagA family TonB-linked outer membrane protein n=1 Tax=Confluentibacter sediminis TaxID=2219045 RepID=UPI000DADA8C2|nr:TonB-dependent receptor [Confluentibacter sediminis]
MRYYLFKLLALFFVAYSSAQNVNISGTTLDANGVSIPGVNIIVKSSSKGTISDFDGNFTLSDVKIGSTLTFSYIGYITHEVVVTNNSKLTIILQEDVASLNEVVVIGYGTQTKKEITGAVSVIGSETIEALKPTRIEQALQGQVAGVNITSQSGTPGGGSTISIRGVSTNVDSRPLILVDGNVIEDLSVLNPNDIESMNILKDATAGIYGVRAANGVILITTKTGRKEMPITVEYNAYGGFQTTTRKIPVLNATEYAAIVNEAYAAGGNTPPFSNLSSLGVGTDWQDEVFENAPIQNHNIMFRGGGKKSSYSYSGSFLTQDGIVGGNKSNFTRFTNNASYNLDFLEHFKFTSGLTLMRTNKRNLPENSNSSVLFNAINMAPTFSVYNEDGSYTLAEGLGGEVINPLAQIDDTFDRGKVMKLSGNAGLSYNFLNHFTVQSNIQFNYSEVRSNVFNPIANFGSGKNSNVLKSSVFEGLNYFRDYTFDAFIKYDNKFDDIHNINILLGTSVLKTTGEYTGATGFNIIGNSIVNANLEQASEIENINLKNNGNPGINATFDSRLLSYFARIQYDYKGKYLLSAVVRRDGSTAFGPKNKFGYFPSGSIGWVVSDEDFLKESSFLNLLKIRASYGILGNDRIGGYRYVSLLNGEGTYIFNDQELIGAASGGIANPEIKWERQKTLDIGLDLRFLNNKINITADYFKKTTDDLLVAPEVSGLLGTGGAPFVNGGSVENKGVEFAIGYSNNFTDDLKFSVNYNVTYIKNEVLSVNTNTGILVGGSFGISQPEPSRMEAGFPMGYFYGYKTAGIFQNQAEINSSAIGNIAPEPGDIKYVDQNNDGEITEADRVEIGKPLPDATMGLNISLDYKNFDFAAYAFASLGNDIVRNYERGQQLTNRTNSYLGRWTGEGTTNSFPRVSNGATPNGLFSDFYVEDGSFVRLQNVQLGYTFSENAFQDSKISKLRLYISASNLLTLTKYKGFDPTASSGAPLGGGIDQGFYPSAKTFLLGINLKF